MNGLAHAALQSMTGFGTAEGTTERVAWRWELRSVNGRGLDLKFKLPTGTESLEPGLRAALRSLHRGSVNVSLRIERLEIPQALTIDEEALAAAAKAIERVRAVIHCDPPRPESVLAMRGVLSSPQPETSLADDELAAMRKTFDAALSALLDARLREGERVAAILRGRCEEMIGRVARVRQSTAGTRDQMAERLRAQLGDLLSDHVSDERLAQEAAMLAIRADVTEELDRLGVHTHSFTELMAQGGAAGRRLEFLTQELMREASTLTAKLHTAELKNEGLDLKEMIDSLREQVLNLA